MKKFLALYMGSLSPEAMERWNSLDEKTRQQREQAGMEGWIKWGQDYRDAIIVGGSPLGKTKRIDSKGVSDTKNAVAGYSIIEAESYEDAAKMFLNHPHFSIFPGDSVEIMECLPIPGM